MGEEIQLNSNCLSRFSSFVLRAIWYFVAMVTVAACVYTEF